MIRAGAAGIVNGSHVRLSGTVPFVRAAPHGGMAAQQILPSAPNRRLRSYVFVPPFGQKYIIRARASVGRAASRERAPGARAALRTAITKLACPVFPKRPAAPVPGKRDVPATSIAPESYRLVSGYEGCRYGDADAHCSAGTK